MKISEHLLNAAERLEGGELAKGTFAHDSSGRSINALNRGAVAYCLRGALFRDYFNDRPVGILEWSMIDEPELMPYLMRAIQHSFPDRVRTNSSLAVPQEFNDDAQTTKWDVIEVLRRAAKLADEDGR